MPTKLAQWTGIAVTAIVVLGSDMDVLYAVPLGLFAGALATYFSALALKEEERRYAASAGIVFRDSSSSRKLG
jgi:hypothetical protein